MLKDKLKQTEFVKCSTSTKFGVKNQYSISPLPYLWNISEAEVVDTIYREKLFIFLEEKWSLSFNGKFQVWDRLSQTMDVADIQSH